VHAEGFSVSIYQLTSFACMSTGKIEGRTVGEGTAGVFEGGIMFWSTGYRIAALRRALLC
jgi:hypothetical protein